MKLASFYSGSGAAIIAKSNAFISILGCKSWEHSRSNHSPKLCALIKSVVNGMIDNSLIEEINATIRDKLLEQDEIDIEKAILAYFAKYDDNIPECIKKWVS